MEKLTPDTRSQSNDLRIYSEDMLQLFDSDREVAAKTQDLGHKLTIVLLFVLEQFS